MTFRIITDARDQRPVRLLCETLEVSTTGYYAWRQRPRQPTPATTGRSSSLRSGRPRRGQVLLRQSPHPRRTGRARSRLLRQHGRQAHPRYGIAAKTEPKVPLHDHVLEPRLACGRQPPGSAVRARPQRGLDWRTLLTSRHARVGCTWPLSRISIRGGLSAGPWPINGEPFVVDALELAVQRRWPAKGW